MNVRDFIMTLSAFSVGSALFTAALALRMVRVDPRRYLAFAAAKTGYAVVAGIILLRIVVPNRELPLDPWAAAYLLGLAIAGVGFVGVGRAIRRDYVEWEVEQELEEKGLKP